MIFRAFLVAMGVISLLLGVIGVFLPVLPTTPFILLAAFCFSKGSPRLHAWLRRQPAFGQMIDDWESGGVVRPRAKKLATFLMVVSFGGITLYSRMPLIGKVILDAIGICVLIFIWSRPSAKVES